MQTTNQISLIYKNRQLIAVFMIKYALNKSKKFNQYRSELRNSYILVIELIIL